MPNLLVVDDEPNVLYSLQQALQSEELTVQTARTARQGIERVRKDPPDVIILDVRLPDMSGLEAYDRIRELDARVPVIVITAFAATETAIEAMKRGAFDYLLKPVDLHQLREVVAKALEIHRLSTVPTLFDETASTDDELADRIVGRSAAMQSVYKAIGRIAPQDVTVLILGESGTGKELVARALYHHSKRNRGPFLALNCAAIPESLLESELFGYDRGAFTGADRQRIGKFEQAHGGTLFLDEIGDMSPATQAKVLRLLQEQRFERLGGSETIQADVRLIAATNQNLEERIAKGEFRQDLYYRLNGFTIALPPLRERMDDLPLLVEHFLRLSSRKLGKTVRGVLPEAMALLERHQWPGNVRELESAIRFAVVQTVGEVITVESLPEYLRGRSPQTVPNDLSESEIRTLVQELIRSGQSDIYRKVIQVVDRVVLEVMLKHVHGNQVQASELLGISRTTLRAKMQALNLLNERNLRPETEPPSSSEAPPSSNEPPHS